MFRPETEPEVFISSPLESPQFMFTVYRDTHGTTRTLATREHVGQSWGPEILMVHSDLVDLA